MKFLVLSDIHANSDALEKVLGEASSIGADLIVSLGDVVGYGANPRRCVELVEKYADIKICGNHDLAAIGETDTSNFNTIASISIEWTSHVLSEEDKELIGRYDPIVSRDGCLFAHSSPSAPLEWEYIYTTRQADRIFREFSERLIFIGHTHVPGIISYKNGQAPQVEHSPLVRLDPSLRYLVNTGSVGQPRDGVGAASFAEVDLGAGIIRMHRTPYDIMSAQARIRTEGLPEPLAERLATAK